MPLSCLFPLPPAEDANRGRFWEVKSLYGRRAQCPKLLLLTKLARLTPSRVQVWLPCMREKCYLTSLVDWSKEWGPHKARWPVMEFFPISLVLVTRPWALAPQKEKLSACFYFKTFRDIERWQGGGGHLPIRGGPEHCALETKSEIKMPVCWVPFQG